MFRSCQNCQQSFEIMDEDLKFYKEISPIFNNKKYEIPPPTFCPDCRQQRRLAFRNEYKLYKRKCDATGEEILSVFSPEKPFKVYKNNYWYSDKWNPLDYEQEYDFNKAFFEQFQELMRKVPQLALSTINLQNCDFTNQCGFCKNCYLIFEADGDDSCYYSNYICDSKSSMDITHGLKCELCYQCVDCKQSYNLKYSQNCQTCTDSFFLKNCIGCKNCFGSVNLRNKEYYFFNKKLSKEEYLEKIKSLELHKYSNIQETYQKFLNFAKKFPNKATQGVQNEDSQGDYIFNTQRCHYCFDVHNAQDCKYIFYARNLKKVYDMTVFGAKEGVEFCYENHEIGGGIKNIYFSDQIWGGTYNIFYSKLCMQNSHDLFGCVGLQHKEYCILNKQYTKEEYEKLVPKIIKKMIENREYGEFFPISLSPFAYNETIAQYYFPTTKEEILKKNLQWKDNIDTIPQAEKVIPANLLPDSISEIPRTEEVGQADDILNWAILPVDMPCQGISTNRPFKIIKPELDFYRQMNLPIPHLHPEERHLQRMSLRNPRKFWDRKCDKCGKEIQTTYSPDRKEIIYCEECYLETII